MFHQLILLLHMIQKSFFEPSRVLYQKLHRWSKVISIVVHETMCNINDIVGIGVSRIRQHEFDKLSTWK
jgi:hypothetical protein